MTTQDVKRKLAAILSADVEGYSRLMIADEMGTIRTLTAYRDAMTNLILLHRGRVVDAPGDNLLAEFVSVVDAVSCAVEIQRELAERNQELPTDKRMQFRIGVNLGDVVEEKERIYGDGVNIAARLESLAESGGICISRTVYDQIKNKLDLEYEYLGEQEVKNIAEPVRAYRVLSYPGAAAHRVIKAKKALGKKWRKISLAIAAVLVIVVAAGTIWNFYLRPSLPQIEAASVEKMAFPLPDKPSIAVLPFVSMSDDPKQEYFSDGITENIITALSKIHDIFVIARNSTFTYKGRAVKIQQVAEELGVRYVLEGSVQRTEDRVRINAQLIDAITGKHLWAERYDRDLADIFALQDEITKKIITSLHIKLTVGDDARLYAQTTDNLEAYLKFLEGDSHQMRLNKDANILARQKFIEAIALDADYIFAMVNLAWTHSFDAAFGWSDSRTKSLDMAEKLAQKALSLDDSFAGTYGVLGSVQLQKGNLKESVALRKKAIALEPNSANYHGLLGIALLFIGNRTEEAIKELKIANRLDPFPPNWILHFLGEAYRVNGEYMKAIEVFKKAIKIDPNYWLSHLSSAACYGLLGREEEARAAAAEVLRIDPHVSIAKVTIPYKDKSDKERTVEVLRKAGLPENPPLPLPDKPSIAVLPFNNMSDDPKQEYFSDGITEDIITDLSKINGLFVIARNSVFTYKGKPVKIKQVAQELGVRYVLEGSVRKAGDKVRINAQLIEASTGHHLWAERYDRDLNDIFALQDEITQRIVMTLRVEMEEAEISRVRRIPTNNLNAYEYALRGEEYFRVYSKSTNLQARQMFERAIEMDRGYASPYVGLGYTYLYEWLFYWGQNPQNSMRAFELAQKAIQLDDTAASGYRLLGMVYLWKDRQHEQAIAAAEKAIALDSNNADGYTVMAEILNFAGKPQEALALMEKAMRLNPRYPPDYLFQLGRAHYYLGQYDKAIAVLKRAVLRMPNHIAIHIFLAASYVELNRVEQARAEVAEILRVSPVTWDSLELAPHKDQAVLDRLRNALRTAGLK